MTSKTYTDRVRFKSPKNSYVHWMLKFTRTISHTPSKTYINVCTNTLYTVYTNRKFLKLKTIKDNFEHEGGILFRQAENHLCITLLILVLASDRNEYRTSVHHTLHLF